MRCWTSCPGGTGRAEDGGGDFSGTRFGVLFLLIGVDDPESRFADLPAPCGCFAVRRRLRVKTVRPSASAIGIRSVQLVKQPSDSPGLFGGFAGQLQDEFSFLQRAFLGKALGQGEHRGVDPLQTLDQVFRRSHR